MSIEPGKLYIISDHQEGPELQKNITFKQVEFVVLADFDLWKEANPTERSESDIATGRNKNVCGDLSFNTPFLVLERLVVIMGYSNVPTVQYKILQTFSDDSKAGIMGYASILNKTDYDICKRARWEKEKVGRDKFMLWECIPNNHHE